MKFIYYLLGCAKSFFISLLCTVIMVFFSERLFWTVFKSGDNPADQIMTLLAYMAPTYIFIYIFRHLNAVSFPAVFINGALYGWLIEGGLTHTLYGTQESATFPISIFCTSVSWHALITAISAWYLIPKFMSEGNKKYLKVTCVSLGIFWGLWAMFLWHETPAIVSTIPEFAAHAFFTSALLIAAFYSLFSKGLLFNYSPGKTGLYISILLLGVFFSEHVKNLGLRPILVLLPLILFSILMLIKNSTEAKVEMQKDNYTNCRQLYWLPLSATITYSLTYILDLSWIPIAKIVFYWLTLPIGIIAFSISIYLILSKKKFLPHRSYLGDPQAPAT